MALVTLTSDASKQASATLEPGKGLEELLYFPQVALDLESDSDENVQEIWALDGKRLELFLAETDKYDEAATNVAEAQEKVANAATDAEMDTAQQELTLAQEAMRQLIIEKSGEGDNKNLTPLPTHSSKAIIECIGFVNKRTYYISKSDLKKVEDGGRGNKQIRFGTDILTKDDKDNFLLALKTGLTDNEKGQADEKLKNKFWEIQNKINLEWKFWEGQTQGQVKIKRLERLVQNPVIRNFLSSTGASEFIDEKVKFFNDTANFSYQQFDQKHKEILDYLKPSNTKFGHYDWGRIILRTQEIWNKQDIDFVKKIQLSKYPVEQKDRDVLYQNFINQPLPEVSFDASGGAQIMRYSANCGGVADLNFADGKISASYGAGAKLSLLDAGAEFNKYFPHIGGALFKFDAPVFIECYERELIQEGTGTSELDPMFAHNSSFTLPSSLLDTAKQLRALSFAKTTHSDDKEILVQVAGYTDATGSNDYNDKLSYRRAKATHAFFVDDAAQWREYFQRGIWKDEERDMMLLSGYMMEFHPTVFKQRFENMKMNDNDKLDDTLLRELQVAVNQYGYPKSAIVSSKMRQAFTTNSNIENSNGIQNLIFPSAPPSDEVIIKKYQKHIKEYILRHVSGISKEDFKAFYIDTELYPIIAKGEDQLKVQKDGRVAANRRITLNAYGLTKKKEPGKTEINLGKGRIKIHGQVTAFVGASLALSAGAELNTYNGAAMLVATKNEGDVATIYENGEVKPSNDDQDLGNATASAKAFVGAEAQAALSAALEWENPENLAAKFGVLASIGGSISGTAGAGIEGEFKIGFDQTTSTFQVKMKAQATWGLGGGGAWSLSVGVQQLYDFIVLVYHKLEENDFNFVDIFEKKLNKNNDETESNANVYELYTIWVSELWQQEEYLKAIGAATSGVVVASWFSLLQSINDNIRAYQESKLNREKTSVLINNVNTDSSLLKFTPPKVKGRMLYMITEYQSFLDKAWDNSNFGDFNKKAEDAAIKIITSVKKVREFKEMMEHYFPDSNNNKGDATKIQESVLYLKNELLNDYDDWKIVRSHLTSLSDWETVWTTKFWKKN